VSGWTISVSKPLGWLFASLIDLEELVLPGEIHVHGSSQCPSELLVESMFSGCVSLTRCSPVNLVLHNMAPGDELSLNNLFKNCHSLQRADVTLTITPPSSPEHRRTQVYHSLTCLNTFSECVNMKACTLKVQPLGKRTRVLWKDTQNMYLNCMSLEYAHVNLKDLELHPSFRARSMFENCIKLSRGVTCEFFKQLQRWPLNLRRSGNWYMHHPFLKMFANVNKASNGFCLDVWVSTDVPIAVNGEIENVPCVIHDIDTKLRHMFGTIEVPKERGKYICYVHVDSPSVTIYATIEDRTRLVTITYDVPLRLAFGQQ
jgi:hypothetical protein